MKRQMIQDNESKRTRTDENSQAIVLLNPISYPKPLGSRNPRCQTILALQRVLNSLEPLNDDTSFLKLQYCSSVYTSISKDFIIPTTDMYSIRQVAHAKHNTCYCYLKNVLLRRYTLICCFMNGKLTHFIYEDDGSLTLSFQDNINFYFELNIRQEGRKMISALQFLSNNDVLFKKEIVFSTATEEMIEKQDYQTDYREQLQEVFQFVESINPNFC